MGKGRKKKEGYFMGNELRAILEKEGISAYRISKQTGIGQSYVGRILHNKTSPSCSTLKRILDVLGYEVCFRKTAKKGG